MIDQHWVAGWIDHTESEKTLIRSHEGFLVGGEGVVFSRAWFNGLALPIAGEAGLGRFAGACISVIDLDDAPAIPGTEWQSLRALMTAASDQDSYRLLVYAAQIATWMREHRFCGHCGTPMVSVQGERARHCPACGLRQYPRISPSMIVLVTRGDEVLLARSPRFLPGVYSTLAGFVEPGESAEDCVHREVQEEVGVRVRGLRYLTSQSWPFPHSLMLGYHAQYESGDITLQPDEIEDARWFGLDDLPALPGKMSIARFLIDTYLAERKGSALPSFPL